MARILVVDDDLSLQATLEQFLVQQGHEVFKASNGLQALELTNALDPDILILAIMIPKINGYKVCQRIRRERNVPIILLSERDQIEDRILGFEHGADDCIAKPLDLTELKLRIAARLRPQSESREQKRLVFDELEIDYEQRQVFFNNNPIKLSPLEFEIIWYLASHPNRVIGQQELWENIWKGRQEINPNLLHVYLRKLRNKLEIDPKNPAHLRNVWGQGYVFKT